ncbi:MAG TPA: amidohydrolase family protein [Methylophilaceae bacterium]|jgi:mannonate dehydratase
MQRRQFLLGLSALTGSSLAYAAYPYWPADLFKTGLSNPCLSGLPNELIEHPLYQQIWQGIDPTQVWDCHVHLVGTGDSGSGAWFNPDMESYLHPILKLQKHFYMNGGCVADKESDRSYVARLLSLVAGMKPGCKAMLFAFEWFHDENGQPDKNRSIFHIPDSYAAEIARSHPESFEWVASIHPYRADCIDALQQAKAQGAKAIKWLPTAMGMNPLSSKCDRFYQAAADLKLPIISHTGRESAVQGGNQDYANPLRLRRALDHGVKVALAHCATDGDDVDLDKGKDSSRVKSFELFTRMMNTPAYEKLLVGEISAIALRNHEWSIKPLLAKTEWHSRLINGSDYPLPAIMPLTDAANLGRAGLLNDMTVTFLQEIKKHNALLFDFALKRLLTYEGHSFSPNIFESRRFFETPVA